MPNECASNTKRKLTKEGAGNTFCLASVGGRISGIMKKTGAAAGILIIDEGLINGAKKCLEQARFSTFEHLQVSDMKFEKGKSRFSDNAIQKVAVKGKKALDGGCHP